MSVRKDGSYIKNQRLQEISRLIAKGLREHQKISFSNLLTTVQYHIGLTKQRSEEYIHLCLANNKYWTKEDDTIKMVESEEA